MLSDWISNNSQTVAASNDLNQDAIVSGFKLYVQSSERCVFVRIIAVKLSPFLDYLDMLANDQHTVHSVILFRFQQKMWLTSRLVPLNWIWSWFTLRLLSSKVLLAAPCVMEKKIAHRSWTGYYKKMRILLHFVSIGNTGTLNRILKVPSDSPYF